MKSELPDRLRPAGEWKVEQIADAFDVEQGLSDKPCFRIQGPEGIEGFYWGWTTPCRALAFFTEQNYGIRPSPIVTTKYFT